MSATRSFILDEAEADAIAELFNIGMGEPAAALSGLVGEPVHLSVPAVALSSRGRVAKEVRPDLRERLCAVSESFSGPFAGEALLLFSEKDGMALVRRMIPDTEALEAPGADEQDALSEVGNIILNGCLASFSNLIEGEVTGSVPDYRAGAPEQILGFADDPVLFVRIDASLASGETSGHVLFLLEIASLEGFRQAVARMLNGIGR